MQHVVRSLYITRLKNKSKYVMEYTSCSIFSYYDTRVVSLQADLDQPKSSLKKLYKNARKSHPSSLLPSQHASEYIL